MATTGGDNIRQELIDEYRAMPLKELLDLYSAANNKAYELLGQEAADAIKAAGIVFYEGMPSEASKEAHAKVNAILSEVQNNPSQERQAINRTAIDLLNIARPRLEEEENRIMDELTGKDQMRAIIDLYELEAYNPDNEVHQQHKQGFEAYNITGISFTGRMPFFEGIWNPKARAFIAQHQTDLLTEIKKGPKRKPGRPRKTGREIDLGYNLSLPTLKGYEHSLSTYPEGLAYVAKLDKDFFESLEYSGDRLHMKGRPDIPVTAQTLKEEEGSAEDFRVLEGLYSAFERHYRYYKARGIEVLHGNNFFISLPQFAELMGVDLRARKGAAGLFEKIMRYERYIGIMKNGDMPRVIQYSDYDKESNTMVLSVPYFGRLIRAIERAAKVIKAGEDGAIVEYYNPTHGRLLHGNILNERDADAEAIVARIQALLMQGTPTGAAISFKQLVEEIPQLASALKNTTGKNAHDIAVKRNITLSRAFKRAYELLQEKTDLYEYFINLRVNGIAKGEQKKQTIPTYKYLENKDLKLILTHEGTNKAYMAR